MNDTQRYEFDRQGFLVIANLQVGYGPHFLMSQNIATMDEPPYLTDATRARLTPAQLDLFRPYPGR